MPQFKRYIGIDYSGAETPSSSLKGLRVYAANLDSPPTEVQPPPSPRKYWTRRGIAEWLCAELGNNIPTLVGIDHAFSFPKTYFEKYHLAPDWPAFLDDFQYHWSTDKDHTYVDFFRSGNERNGDETWFRLTDLWTASAKPIFRFGLPGSVAHSTHAGLPWLRYLRNNCQGRIHFWPFDGWDIPTDRSVIAEVYPSLWMRRFPAETRDGDQQAAYAVAAWLQRADMNGSLPRYIDPPLDEGERKIASIEGWILGVV